MSTFPNISSETTGAIEAIFHVELPWDGRTKVCSNSPGHMTNMATMPIYGKTLFFSGIKRPTTLKLGMQHQILEYYQVYSNDHPELTMTFFTTRSNGPLYTEFHSQRNSPFNFE